MRFSKLAALLAALLLVLAACGDGNGEGDDVPADPPEGDVEPEDDAGAQLDDDVAAVVNGQEIPAEGVEEQAESFADDPSVAEQFEGLDESEIVSLVSAQVLTNAIVTVVAVEAAEELGNPVTDEDLAAARTEVEEETGGAEALDAALEEEGISEDQLAGQLRALAALRNVEESLAEEADGGDEGEAPEDAEADARRRAQEFVSERLANADVIVNDDYGTWDAQTGRVTPPGGTPNLSPPAPQDEQAPPEGEDAPQS